MAKKALVLFTLNFPYYSKESITEHSFLQIEIEYLAREFHPVIIVPNLVLENVSKLPDGIEVEDGYFRAVSGASPKKLLASFFKSTIFWEELFSHPRFWLKADVIRDLLIRSLIINTTCDWIINLVQARGLDPANTIFYTYWLNNITLGVGMAKQKLKGVHLVSRTHRGDLYNESRPHSYFSYRPQTLKVLDRLFLISEHGLAYISTLYPWVADNCEVSRLGVRGNNVLNKGSTDGVFRVVSCSSLIPVKRVALLLKGLSMAAKEQDQKIFEWHHFGSGPLMDELQTLASQCLPSNVSWVFHGNTPNDEVIKFYRENPIDLFVNVSQSEGVPVSIMEAASFGIPIMATAVGGTPELVTEKNGILLKPDPSLEEISQGILKMMCELQFRMIAGKSSFEMWQENYDADKNFPKFVERIIADTHTFYSQSLRD